MLDVKPTVPINQLSLSQVAYMHIKNMILSGELKGGDKISEEKIAAMLNISRTPIREAVRRLEKYGLVIIKPRRYAEVASISNEEVPLIAEVRLELEKLALRRLIKCVTDEDLEVFEQLSNLAETTMLQKKLGESIDWDSALHNEIVRRSGNPHLYDTYERLEAKIQLYRLRPALSYDKHALYCKDHPLLISQLRERSERDVMATIERHIMHDL